MYGVVDCFSNRRGLEWLFWTKYQRKLVQKCAGYTCFLWTGHLKRAECEQLLQVKATSSALSSQWVRPSHQCCEFWQTYILANVKQRVSFDTCRPLNRQLKSPGSVQLKHCSAASSDPSSQCTFACQCHHPFQDPSNIQNKYLPLAYMIEFSTDTLPSQRNLSARQMSWPWLVQGNRWGWGWSWSLFDIKPPIITSGWTCTQISEFAHYLSTVWAEQRGLIGSVVTVHLMATSIHLQWFSFQFELYCITLISLGIWFVLHCIKFHQVSLEFDTIAIPFNLNPITESRSFYDALYCH